MKLVPPPEIRCDYRKYAGDTSRGKRDLLGATDALHTFDRPVLMVWAADDRLMPIAHGRRLAEIIPTASLRKPRTATRLCRKTNPPHSPLTCATSSTPPVPN